MAIIAAICKQPLQSWEQLLIICREPLGIDNQFIVSPVKANRATMVNIEVTTYATVDSTTIGCTTIRAVVDMTLIPVKYTNRKMLHIAKVWSVFFLHHIGRQHSS